MNIAIQIPIRRGDEINFLRLGERPLWSYLLTQLAELPDKYQLYLYTDDPKLFESLEESVKWIKELLSNYILIEAPSWIGADTVNGNQILSEFGPKISSADLFIQVDVRNPFLTAKTIETAVAALADNAGRDSLVSGRSRDLQIWQEKQPNYLLGSPGALCPNPVFIESGFHMIRQTALRCYGTRTGLAPMLFPIPENEAFKLQTQWDLNLAETLLQS